MDFIGGILVGVGGTMLFMLFAIDRVTKIVSAGIAKDAALFDLRADGETDTIA
jgi:hypothetical protein